MRKLRTLLTYIYRLIEFGWLPLRAWSCSLCFLHGLLTRRIF